MDNNLFDALLVLAGPDFDRLSFQELTGKPLIVAVDGGINHLAEIVSFVDLHLGDMDSCQVSADLPKIGEVVKFPPEKDDSDFRLALDLVLNRACKKIAIFGGLGGRIDHFLQIYESAVEYAQRGLEITLFGSKENLHFTTSNLVSAVLPLDTTVSVFAGTAECRDVTLSGFKYPLNNYLLKRSNPIGLSNLSVTDKVEIMHKEGVLVIVVNK